MPGIDAVFSKGEFQPVGPVDLPENQRVQLTVEKVDLTAIEKWLAEAKAFQDELFTKYGFLPDSTPDIVADRRRDG
jgi:hypothetical protein